MNTGKQEFGQTSGGKKACIYTIRKGEGLARITDFGAALVSYMIKDASGKTVDISLGYDDVTGYEKGSSSVGGCVGRNANRIAGVAFTLNGKRYQLAKNEGENNLHSGPDVYEKRFWRTEGVSGDGTSITFSLHSPDGDQGYPGNLDLSVTYSFPEEGALQLCWQARSDQDTICNPTNHSYFNLNGHDSGTDVFGHQLQILADCMTPVRKGAIPTGARAEVAGTPFDFRGFKAIGRDKDMESEQLSLTGGYDHNFVLREAEGKVRKAAAVFSPETGLEMEVDTDAPGLQFYTANFLEEHTGKGGAAYGPHRGFCLETQFFPNAINIPSFPQPVLRAGEMFRSVTIYRVRVRR